MYCVSIVALKLTMHQCIVSSRNIYIIVFEKIEVDLFPCENWWLLSIDIPILTCRVSKCPQAQCCVALNTSLLLSDLMTGGRSTAGMEFIEVRTEFLSSRKSWQLTPELTHGCWWAMGTYMQDLQMEQVLHLGDPHLAFKVMSRVQRIYIFRFILAQMVNIYDDIIF